MRRLAVLWLVVVVSVGLLLPCGAAASPLAAPTVAPAARHPTNTPTPTAGMTVPSMQLVSSNLNS